MGVRGEVGRRKPLRAIVQAVVFSQGGELRTIFVLCLLDEVKDMSGGFILKATQYSVWCATCDNLEDYDKHESKAAAEKCYRQRGWRKTRFGWQCKECANQPHKEPIAQWKPQEPHVFKYRVEQGASAQSVDGKAKEQP